MGIVHGRITTKVGNQVGQRRPCLLEMGDADLLVHQFECEWNGKASGKGTPPVRCRRWQVRTLGRDVTEKLKCQGVRGVPRKHLFRLGFRAIDAAGGQEAIGQFQPKLRPPGLGLNRSFKEAERLLRLA